MRLPRILLTVAALSCTLASHAIAQTCVGHAAFSAGRARLGASAGLGRGAKSFSGALAFGSATGFGSVAAGTTTDTGVDGSAITFGASAGRQIVIGPSRIAQLCPVAGFALGFGPNNIQGSGTDATSRSGYAGLSLGTVITESETLHGVPSMGFAVEYAQTTLTEPLGVQHTFSEMYVRVNLGVGFVVNSVFTILPRLTMPIGFDDGGPSFNVSFALSFGGAPE